MRLRARWIGLLPRASDYLMSSVRPRFAYRVREVVRADPRVRWDPARRAEYQDIVIVVDRVPRDAVPRSARVHAWHWDRREPKSPRLLGARNKAGR